MEQLSGKSRIGEVIESSTTIFRTQSYKLYDTPPLGSFIQTGAPVIFGVVCNITTEPLDPTRPIIARGESASSEEQLYKEHPQLSRLLTSRFEALIIGHSDRKQIKQHLPSMPPKVHSFVSACSDEEVINFSENLDFIHLLLNSGSVGTEEIVLACMNHLIQARPMRVEFRTRIGRALAKELSSDIRQLTSILRSLA